MAAFLFLLVLAAIAGVLGAVLKIVAVIALATAGAVIIIGWFAWRAVRRSLDATVHHVTEGGTTTITIGQVRRDEPLPGSGATHDDRY